jgi:hypothetical protein
VTASLARDIEIFNSHLDRQQNGCWVWTASDDGCFGYGKFYSRFFRKRVRTHRFAFFLAHGRVTEFSVCHTCDNPKCVNPGHLFEGTQSDNMADMTTKGRHGMLGREGKRGSTNAKAKLTEELIPVVIGRLAKGRNSQRLARQMGINGRTLRSIALGETWQHVTGFSPEFNLRTMQGGTR